MTLVLRVYVEGGRVGVGIRPDESSVARAKDFSERCDDVSIF